MKTGSSVHTVHNTLITEHNTASLMLTGNNNLYNWNIICSKRVKSWFQVTFSCLIHNNNLENFVCSKMNSTFFLRQLIIFNIGTFNAKRCWFSAAKTIEEIARNNVFSIWKNKKCYLPNLLSDKRLESIVVSCACMLLFFPFLKKDVTYNTRNSPFA